VSIDAMPRARKPATQTGFSATPANPRALLGEAERLAPAHALLDAQARLDLIEPALGQTPRLRLIQGYVCFQLGRLDRALALLKPLAERQDSISPLACTFLADAWHHAGDRSALAQLLSSRPACAATPEGRLFAARLSATTDPEAAVVAQPQAGLGACLDAMQFTARPASRSTAHPWAAGTITTGCSATNGSSWRAWPAPDAGGHHRQTQARPARLAGHRAPAAAWCV
jgi:hypothetical protein